MDPAALQQRTDFIYQQHSCCCVNIQQLDTNWTTTLHASTNIMLLLLTDAFEFCSCESLEVWLDAWLVTYSYLLWTAYSYWLRWLAIGTLSRCHGIKPEASLYAKLINDLIILPNSLWPTIIANYLRFSFQQFHCSISPQEHHSAAISLQHP